MDETKLSILEKTGSIDVRELVAEVRKLYDALLSIAEVRVSDPKYLARRELRKLGYTVRDNPL